MDEFWQGKMFTYRWEHSGTFCNPKTTGVRHQVPGLCVFLAQASGIHKIDNCVILAEGCGDSSVVVRAVGVLSDTFMSIA